MSQNGVPDGNELQKQAYAQKPIGLESVSVAVVASCLTMVGIATVILILRVYVRGWLLRASASWGWEDTFTVLAYVSGEGILTVVPCHLTSSSMIVRLSDELDLRRALFLFWARRKGRKTQSAPQNTCDRILAVLPSYLWSVNAARQSLPYVYSASNYERAKIPMVSLFRVVHIHGHGHYRDRSFVDVLHTSEGVLESVAGKVWRFHEGSLYWLCLDGGRHCDGLVLRNSPLLYCAKASDVSSCQNHRFGYSRGGITG